jgi:tetratricopeptide (TPR) repeat protein
MKNQSVTSASLVTSFLAGCFTLLFICTFSATARARQSQLGKVDFPTSGSEQAQQFFIRGVAALHSFWFEEAHEAFQQATKIEPDFMMGYWGDAMAYNHPLWSEQDYDAGKGVTAKIKETPKLTAKERAFLHAVKLLYGEGSKLERDKAYCAAMEKIYRDYPDDLEAASFYALSLLGTVRPGDKGFRRQALAGAIALEVFRKNPNHPGAAHYIIHAFDDPDHAILALPAAYRYAEIAPEAHHARHMPSHIFLQLGMWPEAAKSNESSWATSDEWVRRKNLSIALRDYHSLQWLLYIYCQQGRYSKAEQLLGIMRKAMAESTYDDKLRPNYYANNWANMAGTFIIESERWGLLDQLFPAGSSAVDPGGEAHGAAQSKAAPQAAVRSSPAAQIVPIFVRGFAKAIAGSSDAEAIIEVLRARSGSAAQQATSYGGPPTTTSIRQFEVEALLEASRGKFDDAIAIIRKATALEDELGPPSGPPALIKPSHELAGEILLKAGKAKEAAEMFSQSLLKQPNRARSLLGAARAAAKGGDSKSASEFYSRFLRQWQDADSGLPELREAQDYLKQARAQ